MAAEAARHLDALMPELRSYARQLCANWSEADDLLQAMLLRLWSAPDASALDGGALRARALEVLREKCQTKSPSQRVA